MRKKRDAYQILIGEGFFDFFQIPLFMLSPLCKESAICFIGQDFIDDECSDMQMILIQQIDGFLGFEYR